MSYKGRDAVRELLANGKKRAQVIFDARDDANGSVGAGHWRAKLRMASAFGPWAAEPFLTFSLSFW